MQIQNPQTFLVVGDGSMGDSTDRASICRFHLDRPYAPMWLEASFSGGTGSADFIMYVDYMDANNDYVFEVFTQTGTGTGGTTTIDKHWTEDELYGYVIARPRYVSVTTMPQLVMEWTNPNTQTWKLALTLGEVIS